MRKIYMTLAVILLAITSSAQNCTIWEHLGNDGNLHQCYDIIEMSDGDFLVDDDIFVDNEDFGMMLYKITPDAVLVDSVFIPADMLKIMAGYPKTRDPFNDDRVIFTSFYNKDGRGYYKALSINNNLDVVDETEAELGIGGEIGSGFRAFINPDNDIVIHDCINDTTERFYIVGLDGETKFVSESVERKYKQVAQRPLFVISKDPLRYGFITLANHPQYGDRVYIEEYDIDFNRLERHLLHRIDQSIWLDYDPNMYGCYLDDESFIVTMDAETSGTSVIQHYNIAIKFNHDFQPVATHVFGDSYKDYLQKRNIAVTDDGRIYVIWVDDVGAKSNLMVDCLDFNLNLMGRDCGFGYPHIANFGLCCRQNGGLALSGWVYDSYPLYYESSIIYAVIFNEFLSIAEPTVNGVSLCYPNPAGNSLYLDISPDTEVVSISLYDLCGRMIRTQTANFENVDISGFAPGVYVMKVVLQNGKTFEEKIVKK